MDSQRSFTLIELLVVISIIGLIASLILVGFGPQRQKARIAKTLEFQQSVHNVLGVDAVGVWDFDEGSGSVARDGSGYDNEGTITGATYDCNDTPYNEVGQGGERCALLCASKEQNVNVSDNTSLTLGASDFTLAGWVKISQPAYVGCGIFGNYPHAGQNGDMVVGISQDTTDLFLAHANTSGYTYCSYDFDSYFNKWTHIVWTKNVNSLQLYINGQLKQSCAIAFSFNVDFGSDGYYICTTDWCPGTFSQWKVDDHRLYKRTLTFGEIQKLYAEGLPRHKLAEK